MNDLELSPRERVSPVQSKVLVAVALLAILSASGCQGFLHARTGGVMSSYSMEHLVPYMMASDDLSMVCEAGVSMGSFLMSFERVNDAPHEAALVTLLSAGMCAEAEAWEANLRSIRAMREGRAGEVRDARILQQRSHAVAARRFYAAFGRMEAAYGPVGEGCPRLDEDQELFYLVGLSAGILAVFHDRAADGTAGVPMDIPRVVERAAACIDNHRWWGVPLALQAAVWATVPGAGPEGVDPFEALARAALVGESARVRLARAFQVQILETSGQSDALREAIRAHTENLDQNAADPEWLLMDAYATRMILHVSDVIWSAERGHRTPLGALGTFWQPPAAVESPDDDMFDDLFDDLDADDLEEEGGDL